MQTDKMKVLHYLKKSGLDKSGQAPIMGRITYIRTLARRAQVCHRRRRHPPPCRQPRLGRNTNEDQQIERRAYPRHCLSHAGLYRRHGRRKAQCYPRTRRLRLHRGHLRQLSRRRGSYHLERRGRPTQRRPKTLLRNGENSAYPLLRSYRIGFLRCHHHPPKDHHLCKTKG